MSTYRSAFSGLFLAAAAIALTATAQPASAEPANGKPVRVFYGDLNLNSQAGAQAMLRRVEFAASKACGGTPGKTRLRQFQLYHECVQETTDRTVQKLNAPLVTALHRQGKAYAEASPLGPRSR